MRNSRFQIHKLAKKPIKIIEQVVYLFNDENSDSFDFNNCYASVRPNVSL